MNMFRSIKDISFNRLGLSETVSPRTCLIIASLGLFALSLLKLFLFVLPIKLLAFTFFSWSLLTVFTIYWQRGVDWKPWLFMGVMVLNIEYTLSLALTPNNMAARDTGSHLGEANYIADHGGFPGLLEQLFLGQYPFSNRQPLISLLTHYFKFPGLEWFTMMKVVAVFYLVLFLIALHYFLSQWGNQILAVLGVSIFFIIYPEAIDDVTTINADLLVSAFILLAFGLLGGPTDKIQLKSISLSGLAASLAYWTKASALISWPFLIAIIFVKNKKRDAAVHGLIYVLILVTLCSPLFVNNYSRYDNPLFNFNQRYMFTPRHVIGNNPWGRVQTLPSLGGITEKIRYIATGLDRLVWMSWNLGKLWYPLNPLLWLCLIGGIYVLVNGRPSSLIFIYGVLVFLVHSMYLFLAPRFLIPAWACSLLFMGKGISWLLDIFHCERSPDHESSSDWLKQRTNKFFGRLHERKGALWSFSRIVIYSALGLSCFAMVIHYLTGPPHTAAKYMNVRFGGIRGLNHAVKVPSDYEQLARWYKKVDIKPSDNIIFEPADRYTLSYFGHYRNRPFPKVSGNQDPVPVLKEIGAEYLIASRPFLRKKSRLFSLITEKNVNSSKTDRENWDENTIQLVKAFKELMIVKVTDSNVESSQ